uniref:Putative reverse transcriptase domain-containing protein n=1 Tax=Tanacetum cinerariifolium TaxID=118510 RepID=A0A699GVJ9_TANCI|nr:putative reverse transcriptase domain-containing protein [Tanacetum cinerariifolium]
MSSASYAVTYTSVYTDSEPGRPVAPPTPDYIPCPEEPQTPPVPQDKDERELMFIQPHDLDYVPEPMYPEYIPLEDEYVLPAEEHPLPPIDSPTVESPGYVIESDPEEDPQEYEDDQTENGPVDYPIDGGDDGDDDDGDSSRDDIDDEDEDEDDGEEEHLASADSAVVIPMVELVFPPRGTKPGAISLPPEAEVERLLAMPTPPPSPLTSLSPPFAGERLARCTAPSACTSPPPVPSPLLPSSGCPTQIQTLRMASTQALIESVTATLPSSPLPPPLYIPPPIDHRDDVPETEMPPRKRLCLSTLGSRYEIREISTARLTKGRGIDYGFVSTLDAEARRRGLERLGEVNTRVTELAELHEHDIQDLYALLEDAQDSRTRISQRVTMDSQWDDLLMEDRISHQETILIVKEEAYAAQEAWAHSIGLSQAVHFELQTYREQTSGTDDRDSLSDGKHETRDGQIMAPMTRQGPNIPPNNTNPNNMTPEFVQVKFATCTLLDAALTRWNSQIRSLGLYAYSMTWEVLKKRMTDKYCPQGEVKKLEIELWNPKVKGNDVPTYTERFQELTLICTKFVANETKKIDKYISGLPNNIYGNTNNKRKADDLSRNNHGAQQQPAKRQNVAKGGNREIPKGNCCFECGALGNFKRDCPKLKNMDGGNINAQGWVYDVELADGKIVGVNTIMRGCTLKFLNHTFNIDLIPIELGSFDVIIGMDWLRRCHAVIVCDEKLVRVPYGNETLIFCDDESNDGKESWLTVISCLKAQEDMAKGCQIFLAHISAKKEEDKSEGKQLKDVPIVSYFPEVFPEDLSGLPPARPVEFQIDLIPGAAPVARAPYRLAPSEIKELSKQLQELFDKGFIRPSSSP